MSDDSDFFGDVFDDPEDDPLLGSDSNASDASPSDEPEHQGPPSWMSDDPETNGETSDHDVDETPGPERKKIVVDENGREGEGIDVLNQALGEGWRLVRISLDRPDGEQVASPKAVHRFVATLEQENPQSLFDFG